jgi:GNAT superfamily N-acetyltransferase
VSDVDIRRASAADLAAVGRPARERDEVVLVAWCDGEPVGTVALGLGGADHPFVRERLPRPPVVHHLAVAPGVRRRGIGTALLAAAEQAAQAHGHGMVLLLVAADDADGLRLLRRAGYDDWGHGEIEADRQLIGADGVRRRCQVLIKLIVEGVPGLSAWDAWHPREAARRLTGLDVPWHVAGGWALDLWHGRQTRPHGDLEIAVARADLPAVHAQLAGGGFVMYTPTGDGLHRLGPGGTGLADDGHQMWVCEPDVPAWRMDVFCEPRDPDEWICRHDPRIREPYARMVGTTSDGLAYLRPEGVLLYKARHRLPKNETDLALALPRLDEAARGWLAAALALAYPDHPWRTRVEAAAAGGADPGEAAGR